MNKPVFNPVVPHQHMAILYKHAGGPLLVREVIDSQDPKLFQALIDLLKLESRHQYNLERHFEEMMAQAESKRLDINITVDALESEIFSHKQDLIKHANYVDDIEHPIPF